VFIFYTFVTARFGKICNGISSNFPFTTVHLLHWFCLEYSELDIGRQIVSIHLVNEDHLKLG
jgi:hypothetical protein